MSALTDDQFSYYVRAPADFFAEECDSLRAQLAAKDVEIARLRDEYLYLRELFLIARPLLKNVGDILDQRIDAALKGHAQAPRDSSASSANSLE